MLINSLTIKARLLVAVTALALSTLTIGITSWYWLSRSNTILEELHETTLSEVNRSHELTKQTSLFTTSAPYLLNLRSSYLVESEGNKLLSSIDAAIASWETRTAVAQNSKRYSADILESLGIMRELMESLINKTRELSDRDDDTRVHTAKLVEMEKQLLSILTNDIPLSTLDGIRQAQLAVNVLVIASHANSLLSLGEYQRRFLKATQSHLYSRSPDAVKNVIAETYLLAEGSQGLFKTRFVVLQHNVSARRLLSSISAKAGELNLQVLRLIQNSESEIDRRREETTANIQYAKILVALFGIGSIALSLMSAFYISGYIIKRLNTITTTMTGLAGGDLSIGILENVVRQDELGALQNAFNVFHANALRHNRLNKELIHKTALFESTFNNITDGVAITNANGRLLAFNPQLNHLLAHFGSENEATIGSNLSDKVETLYGKLKKSRQTSDNTATKELLNSVGHVLEIRTSALPDGGGVWLFSDTTERRRIEERLQHFQRLESLGQLTGEVAHDFNNVLTAIKATLSTVLTLRQDESEHQLAVEKIEDAVDMGNSLTHRLLAFAKKQRLDPKYVEINELVSGVSELISLSLGSRIELVIVNSESTLNAYIDPLQLESTLLNLCMNSAHAIRAKGRIVLTVEESANSMLSIHVQDNGCGMSSENVIRAVEPFYSTRRGSSGTGLGLSIVYGFVKQSGGDMHIKSALNVGTTVSLSLRRVEIVSDPRTGSSIKETGASKTALIVEDDEDTMDRAVEILQCAGYKTTQAQNYHEAERIIGGGVAFSLLFTDLHLGLDKTGWDLASLCLHQRSAEKIIVTSGRLLDLAAPPEHLRNHCAKLEKPYNMQDVVATIAHI